jgi:RNA polymerase sigma-70 factor (ECF subfamily)
MPEALRKIIQKAQRGDTTAFAFLVEEYQQYAFSLAFRILCDEEEAKDTVQESFIKIWKKLGTFDTSGKFTTWMYTIVTNCAIDRFRAIKRRKLVSMDEVAAEINLLSRDQVNRQMDNREIGQLIRFLAEALPEKQRLVFVLRDLQGLDSKETQEILHETEVFVKSNLYQARKTIKEKLNRMMQFERR